MLDSPCVCGGPAGATIIDGCQQADGDDDPESYLHSVYEPMRGRLHRVGKFGVGS